MLNSKDLIKDVSELIVKDKNVPYVAGNGICTHIAIGFDQKKLEEKKSDIAKVLQAIGADEHPLISLAMLTKLKDGTVWNNLDTIEDFQGLELLVACASACNLILNNDQIKQMNIAQMGETNSILISQIGRDITESDEQWLGLIKEFIMGNMFFVSNMEAIKELAAPTDEAPKKTGSL